MVSSYKMEAQNVVVAVAFCDFGVGVQAHRTHRPGTTDSCISRSSLLSEMPHTFQARNSKMGECAMPVTYVPIDFEAEVSWAMVDGKIHVDKIEWEKPALKAIDGDRDKIMKWIREDMK